MLANSDRGGTWENIKSTKVVSVSTNTPSATVASRVFLLSISVFSQRGVRSFHHRLAFVKAFLYTSFIPFFTTSHAEKILYPRRVGDIVVRLSVGHRDCLVGKSECNGHSSLYRALFQARLRRIKTQRSTAALFVDRVLCDLFAFADDRSARPLVEHLF